MSLAADKESVTQLLNRISAGDTGARDVLFQSVYSELRYMAAALMRKARRNHTLLPTDLVHEAAMRILHADSLTSLNNRRTLFAVAAHSMRSILVDYARQRAALKRPTGSGRQRTPMDEVLEHFEASERCSVVALEDALVDLREQSQRHHEIVVLHFFGGMKFTDIAEHLSISLSTVEKSWRFARCWLVDHMHPD
ncbi:MAG: sigma-70 family RNA polymerase sigma factor [Planctomycetales bacterium]|nr:sigma-70 family RNA polymerase sigma factor [Planctomycetales bacterium]